MPLLGRKIKVFGLAWKHLSWKCMLGAVGFNNLRPGGCGAASTQWQITVIVYSCMTANWNPGDE